MSVDAMIVKIASGCNLLCDYCYEYQAGDHTWRSKPPMLTSELARTLGWRIREYCHFSGKESIAVVGHGGEPLLVGHRRLRELLEAILAGAYPFQVCFSLQTNATLIDREFCDVFRDLNVSVGVSMDGGERHSHRRVDRRGNPSWQSARAGIDCLQQFAPNCFAGVLCVIDLDTEPEEVLDALLQFRSPMIDLLQPFMSLDDAGERRQAIAARFGVWITRALRHWLRHPSNTACRVRVLEDALQAVVTGRPKTDWFGPRGVSYLVVETDGSYDLLDQLKSIGSESARFRGLGMDVNRFPIAQAERGAVELMAKFGAAMLPDGCSECRWATVCAGGHLPSRYSLKAGFNNRSTYCEGIQSLLDTCLQQLRAVGAATERNAKAV